MGKEGETLIYWVTVFWASCGHDILQSPQNSGGDINTKILQKLSSKQGWEHNNNRSKALSPHVGSLGKEAVEWRNQLLFEEKIGQAWALAGRRGRSWVILPAFGA